MCFVVSLRMAESESLPGTLANIIEETTLKWIFVGGMRHMRWFHGYRTGCDRFFRREGRGRQDHDELLPGHRARESSRIRSDTQPPSHRGLQSRRGRRWTGWELEGLCACRFCSYRQTPRITSAMRSVKSLASRPSRRARTDAYVRPGTRVVARALVRWQVNGFSNLFAMEIDRPSHAWPRLAPSAQLAPATIR